MATAFFLILDLMERGTLVSLTRAVYGLVQHTHKKEN